MAKVYNTFTNGRMDSDTHHSLVDNKGYSYALNLRPSGYGEDGAMSSIRGSELLVDYSEEGTMTVVGMYSGDNNKLYSFLARRDGLSKIIETDIETKQSRVVIEDAEHLRFDLLRWENCEEVSHRYLLSVNQIDNYLYFSNEVWEQPRVVDITRDYGDFGLEDILVAKKPPRYAPRVEVSEFDFTDTNSKKNKFISFAYRYKYSDGSYSVFSFYSDVLFLTGGDYHNNVVSRENVSMINHVSKYKVIVNTGGRNVIGLDIIAREHNSNTAYIIFSFEKWKTMIDGKTFGDNMEVYCYYEYSTNYPILEETVIDTLYSNLPKFPKAQNYIGNRMFYGNYKENVNLLDINKLPITIDIDYKRETERYVHSKKNTLVSDFYYKIGVVYYNDYNECTTVLLNSEGIRNEIHIPFSHRKSKNSISAKIKHKPPYWATKFKFVMLSEKLNYNNFIVTHAKKINQYAYAMLEKADMDKVRKEEKVYIVNDGVIGDDYFYIEEAKTYGANDGLRDGFYIKFLHKDRIPVPDNFETFEKRHIVEWQYIYQVKNSLEKLPSAVFYSTSGYADTGELFTNGNAENISINSQYNHGFLQKSDYPNHFNIGDSIKISIMLKYGVLRFGNYPRKHHEEINSYSSVLLHMNLQAKKHYNNLFEFISNENSNNMITVQDGAGKVFLQTNDNYLNMADGAIMRLEHLTFAKDIIRVKTETKVVFEKGGVYLHFRTENKDTQNPYFYESPLTYDIEDGEHKGAGADGYWDTGLYNGYCWGNGIESYKIKDNLNGKRLEWSFRPNAVDPRGYGQVHRKNDITYSGVYNKDYRVNNLNMFIPSTANWRELPSEYGQIQRIVSSDGDITVFCDDKVITVFYGKTLISDLQGNQNLATTQDVLGGHVVLPYNFGCQHPESISQSVDGIYFTDKKRKRYIFMSNKQMFELNPEGSGHHRLGVEEIKGTSLFLSYYDEGYGEWVAGLGKHNSVVFNPQAKGFSHYYDYSFEYIHGMNGRRFTAYKGKIYEDEVLEDECNIFAGGQERSAKLTYVVNSEFGADKVFKAMSLQSSIPWDTVVRTNLVGSRFLASAYTKKESFYHTHIYRDVETSQNSRGIGVIQSVLTPDMFQFSRPIDIDVSCGDILKNEQGTGTAVIENIQGNTITVNNGADFHAGDYVFARKQNHGGYSPDGAPIRGKWLQVDLSCKWHENFYITSTSTEIIESKF